ncbi:carbon starvation CstA family protein [Halalkalicoccus salilacus]|uniref:carbon starvation CstA family protein n=1 Tax=Halalkalicoccus TaxID=332246 RepID=UPI002F967C2B
MVAVIWIVALVLVTFSVMYVGYGRYLSRFVDLDDEQETPAHRHQDGQEYVPARKSVLFGHHFSSIAGGAPIVGPITAALIWGWVPALVWIAIGNPLMGAVHDFTSLSSSLRHEGKSIGYIIGEYVGEQGKDMLLWFAFLLIILVVAVFALVVGVVFTAYPQAATASVLYIALAAVFGVWLYQLGLSFAVGTVIFVAGVFGTVWLGIQYPFALVPGDYPAGTFVLLESAPGFVPSILESANIGAWVVVTLVYGGAASVLPVWVLLQPRDYLSSFLLYTGVGGGLLAVVLGTFVTSTSQPLEIAIPAWYGFLGSDLVPFAMPLFPLLFLTIACGTISGFHSLVSSGTTAKQLNKESDARLIGYGGMLAEGLLAAVALCTVALIAATPAEGGIALALPNFADGGGIILTALGVPQTIGTVFMALVLVSFLLTSMDTGVRLGRYMVEEIVGTPETTVERYMADKYLNSSVIVVVAFFLVASGSWEDLWPLFGGANQLLAALALLTATIWLANWHGSKQLLSTGVPMAVMVVITVFGLLWLVFYQNVYVSLLSAEWRAGATALEIVSVALQSVLALVLVGLAAVLLRIGYGELRSTTDVPAVADGGEGDRSEREARRATTHIDRDRADGSRSPEPGSDRADDAEDRP